MTDLITAGSAKWTAFEAIGEREDFDKASRLPRAPESTLPGWLQDTGDGHE